MAACMLFNTYSPNVWSVSTQADDFMLANPQTTLGAVHFNATDTLVCQLLDVAFGR